MAVAGGPAGPALAGPVIRRKRKDIYYYNVIVCWIPRRGNMILIKYDCGSV